MLFIQALIGMLFFISVSFAMSERRELIPWKKVFLGFLMAFGMVLILTSVPAVANFFLWLNKGVGVLDKVTQKSSSFIFGYLGGGSTPFTVVNPENLFVIAFRVLPLILVVTVLSNILFYLRILPFIIRLFSKLLHRTLGISSPLAFGAAASVFLGTIESPLIIKQYLGKLSRGELFSLISCSMATVAGSVMVLYATTLSHVLPNAIGHLMIASLMSVPVALSLSFMVIPHGDKIDFTVSESTGQVFTSFFDAIMTGIKDGLEMVLQIAATLLVLFALVYLVNEMLSLIPGNYSLEIIVGWIARPVMWLIGIPWGETQIAGELMGIKIILNEFVAYLTLPQHMASLSPRTITILTYALCGFANLASVGIIIGGLSSLLPERKKEVAELSVKSLIVGNMATMITGLLVGLVYS
ncbi:MAG: hypothetical protein K2P81_11520 [Bacteriovoracaceae bacterium]|nr:hypothetical protein [Bacteriovoracaceae bacterium]